MKRNLTILFCLFTIALFAQSEQSIFIAAQKNDVEGFRKLLESGSSVNQSDLNGVSLAQYAIENDSYDVVKLMIEKGYDVNTNLKPSNISVLMYCCYRKKFEIAKLFIKKGANVNYAIQSGNLKGTTPLITCAMFGSLDLTKLLVEKGADLNAADDKGDTPIIAALGCKYPEIARYLIEKGADVNKKNKVGWTPVLGAIFSDSLGIAEFIIPKSKSVINERDIHKQSPLVLAIGNNRLDLVKLLIQNGADVNGLGYSDKTLLRICCANAKLNFEILKAIVDARADLNRMSSDSILPIYQALISKRCDFVDYLFKKGANVNNKYLFRGAVLDTCCGFLKKMLPQYKGNIKDIDETGFAPIHYAISAGTKETIDALISKGANINLKTSNGQTALMLAVSSKRSSYLVPLLIKKGAKINDTTNDGFNLAHYAAQSDNIEIMKMIFDKKIDINKKSAKGVQPIITAIDKKSFKVATFLLEKGCSLDNPKLMDYACARGANEIIKVLNSKGLNINNANKRRIIDSDNEETVRWAVKNNVIEPNAMFDNKFSFLALAVSDSCYNSAKVLLESGGNINTKISTSTLLHIAVQHKDTKMASLLISKGIKIDEFDSDGYTPFMSAAYSGDINMMEYLLKSGADINKCNQKKWNALHLCIYYNYMQSAAYLLKKGIEKDAQTYDEFSPLGLAIQQKNAKAVQLLLEFGANPNAHSYKTWVPVRLAKYYNLNDIVDMLKAKGGNEIDLSGFKGIK